MLYVDSFDIRGQLIYVKVEVLEVSEEDFV